MATNPQEHQLIEDRQSREATEREITYYKYAFHSPTSHRHHSGHPRTEHISGLTSGGGRQGAKRATFHKGNL